MGPALRFSFGQLTHRDASCVCIPHWFFHLVVVPLSSVCVFISLCVAFVVLALIFLLGLYFAANRATYPA